MLTKGGFILYFRRKEGTKILKRERVQNKKTALFVQFHTLRTVPIVLY